VRVERSRGRLSLKWASATALRGYGYVIQALGPRRQRLVGLIKLAVDLTPDSAAHFRVGPAVAERRRRRMLGMDVESTGSCPAPSAGGASSGGPSASGGSPSDASGGAGPAGPNEADEDDDEEEGDDDDLISGASECSGSISGSINDVFETAKRCLAELKAAHVRRVPIRLVELQAAVLARCPRYPTDATRAIAPCTDADFAEAYGALRAVGAELKRLATRVIANMQRGLTVFDM
jgi:hypothetical protein